LVILCLVGTDFAGPPQEETPLPPPWEPMEGRLGQDDIRGITGQDSEDHGASQSAPLTFREEIERETVRPQRVAQALDTKYSLNNLTPDNNHLPPPTYADSRVQDVDEIQAVVRNVTGANGRIFWRSSLKLMSKCSRDRECPGKVAAGRNPSCFRSVSK
jgi:hypothetical protein